MSAAASTEAASDFLMSEAELERITGYRRPRDQVAWIREHYSVPAHVNAANEAVVFRAHLEAARTPEQNRKSVRTVRSAR